MKQLYLLLAVMGFTSTFAQTPRLYGGAGFFRVGYANLHQISQALSQFTPASGSSAANDFVYIGGEGYARLNKYIVGGGGYGMARRSWRSSTIYAEPFSGGGYLYVGRLVVNTHRFWLYPLVGAGVTVVGLTQREQQGTNWRESSVMLPNANAQLAIGADWLLAGFGEEAVYGGLLLGLRAGYQMSPYASGWQTRGDITTDDRPRYATNGYFITLTIGVGAFRLVGTK